MALEWTEDARAEFDRWSKRRIRGEGLEASVARDRMRALVEAELANGPRPIEAGELRTALARAVFVAHARELEPNAGRRGFIDFCLLLLTAVVPALALLIEVSTQFCARHYVDFFPTYLHWALGVSAPFAASAAWRSVRQPSPRPRESWIAIWLGAAIPFTFLVFAASAPMTMIALAAIVFPPAGLVLVPIACLPAQLLLASRFVTTSSDDERARRGLWLGVLLGTFFVVAAELAAHASGAKPIVRSVLEAYAHWR